MKELKRREYTLISGKEKIPIFSKKQNRNELCKCGSGLKAKKCCGCKTEYFQKN